jgi:NAD(P)-dependent dehydrogenase (short-subunit alcohol dehydrogenase family)
MNHFMKKVAIVTGGASGIGRALCLELGRQGATVVVADIDHQRAQHVMASILAANGHARVQQLDVRHADQVQKVVDETISEIGQIDYMFNNAGIAMCGDMRDMGMEHFRPIVDINLWGVIHGTMAAYQAMARQGFGHIINTASLGGLIPEPMATAYVMTKHAVVGLSTSLRIEGADLGVKVSVVCPGFVKTHALDAATYIGVDREAAIAEMSGIRMVEATKCARVILKGIERNKAIITDSSLSRAMWWLYRMNPGILTPFLEKGVSDIRALRIDSRTVS